MEVAANDEINIEEVPKLIPTDLAIAVSIGAVADPHHSNEAVTTKPIMIFLINYHESRQRPLPRGKEQPLNLRMVTHGFLAILKLMQSLVE